MAEDDYCELCDLKRSECLHGMPKPEPKAEPVPRAATRAAAPRKRAAPRTTPRAASRPTPGVATHAATRRWTATVDFVPHIIAVLQEADGGLESDVALTRVQERMAEQLLPGDHESTPQGDPRWRSAARKARRSLVEEGVLAGDRPGIWRLAD